MVAVNLTTRGKPLPLAEAAKHLRVHPRKLYARPDADRLSIIWLNRSAGRVWPRASRRFETLGLA